MTTIIRRIDQARKLINAVSTAQEIWDKGREHFNERFRYTAQLNDSSPIFEEAMEWLQTQVNSRRFNLISYGGTILKEHAQTSRVKVNVGGHQVSVATMQDQKKEDGIEFIRKTLYFNAYSKEGIDAVVEFMNELYYNITHRVNSPKFYIPGKYNRFEATILRNRPKESVILPNNQRDDILLDMDKFIKSEERIVELGLPWHRGYLFYGPPGNGKTAMANLIASEYNLNFYVLPLNGITGDAELLSYIGELNPRSVLLIEDIDAFRVSHERDEKTVVTERGVSLSGVLNAIDGLSTPHGLITIMTTNKRENIDSALLRAGRADRQFYFDSPGPLEISKMFEHFYNEPLLVTPKTFECMADVAEVFKENVFDPEAARMELKDER